MTLLETTNRMLDSAIKSGLSLGEIARRSDGTVDREWLKKFTARDRATRDATVSRVQALHDCLIALPELSKRKRA